MRERSTPSRIFDPCHDNADTRPGHRAHGLPAASTQSGPGYSLPARGRRLRELIGGQRGDAAREERAGALPAVRLRRRRSAATSGSRPPRRSARSRRTTSSSKVNHGYSDYGLTTLATSWVVVRVGNAVRLPGRRRRVRSEQGTQTRAVVDGELDAYDAMAASMCPFADETTDIGCAEPSTAAGPGEVTRPGARDPPRRGGPPGRLRRRGARDRPGQPDGDAGLPGASG